MTKGLITLHPGGEFGDYTLSIRGKDHARALACELLKYAGCDFRIGTPRIPRDEWIPPSHVKKLVKAAQLGKDSLRALLDLTARTTAALLLLGYSIEEVRK